jgi:hypothetical protein
VILARIQLRRPDDLPDPAEIEKAVREMDRDLDACFLDDLAPALERARLARAPSS